MYGSPQAVQLSWEEPFFRVGDSPLEAKSMAGPGQEACWGPLRGAFWAEVEVGFLKVENELRAWMAPAGDSSWPVPALPGEAGHPQSFPAARQWSGLGC